MAVESSGIRVPLKSFWTLFNIRVPFPFINFHELRFFLPIDLDKEEAITAVSKALRKGREEM